MLLSLLSPAQHLPWLKGCQSLPPAKQRKHFPTPCNTSPSPVPITQALGHYTPFCELLFMAASVLPLCGTSSAAHQSQVVVWTPGGKICSKGDGGGEGPAGKKARDGGITVVPRWSRVP